MDYELKRLILLTLHTSTVSILLRSVFYSVLQNIYRFHYFINFLLNILFYRYYIQKRWLNKGDNNMKDNQVSFTSLLVAYMRAYHTIHDTQKIFDDFLAYDLIPKEKRELIEQHLIEDYSALRYKIKWF